MNCVLLLTHLAAVYKLAYKIKSCNTGTFLKDKFDFCALFFTKIFNNCIIKWDFSFFFQMDFERLNNVAKGPTCVPIAELDLDRRYQICDIRKVRTREYGEKVVVDLEGDIFSYLPNRLSVDLLQNNEAELKKFQQQLETATVFLYRLPGKGRWHPIEFEVQYPDDPGNQGAPEEALKVD